MKAGPRPFPARVEELIAATVFVEACADGCGFGGRGRYGLLLAFEEAFVNVCRYAYPPGEGVAEVGCDWDAESFTLELSDLGRAFDVLSLPDPDLKGDVMERPVGGLGVYFIRKCSRHVAYRREHGRNVLTMVFARDRAAAVDAAT